MSNDPVSLAPMSLSTPPALSDTHYIKCPNTPESVMNEELFIAALSELFCAATLQYDVFWRLRALPAATCTLSSKVNPAAHFNSSNQETPLPNTFVAGSGICSSFFFRLCHYITFYSQTKCVYTSRRLGAITQNSIKMHQAHYIVRVTSQFNVQPPQHLTAFLFLYCKKVYRLLRVYTSKHNA